MVHEVFEMRKEFVHASEHANRVTVHIAVHMFGVSSSGFLIAPIAMRELVQAVLRTGGKALIFSPLQADAVEVVFVVADVVVGPRSASAVAIRTGVDWKYLSRHCEWFRELAGQGSKLKALRCGSEHGLPQ